MQKERLISKEKVDGRWEYTIWKVEADALPWKTIEDGWLAVMERV